MRFEISEVIAEKGKAYSDGEVIKNCLELFPKKKCVVDQLSLSRFTVARRIDKLSKNNELSLKQNISKCSAFSNALEESKEVNDTVQ